MENGYIYIYICIYILFDALKFLGHCGTTFFSENMLLQVFFQAMILFQCSENRSLTRLILAEVVLEALCRNPIWVLDHVAEVHPDFLVALWPTFGGADVVHLLYLEAVHEMMQSYSFWERRNYTNSISKIYINIHSYTCVHV